LLPQNHNLASYFSSISSEWLKFALGSAANSMRLIKTITLLSLVFWTIQLLAYIFLLASSFTDLIIRLFVSLGLPVPEARITTLLSTAMTILSWPVRVLFAQTWNQASSVTAMLLLGLNSLIWGVVFGSLIYAATQNSQKSPVSHS